MVKKLLAFPTIAVGASLIVVASVHLANAHSRESPNRSTTAISFASSSKPCCDSRTLPPYNAAAIVKDAEQAYRSKDYAGAVVFLSELHADDLNRPKTHVLWNSASAQLEHQKSVQEAADRAEYASNYESALLGAGMDATVRAQGAGNKTLYVSYPLMSRPLVYQIMNPGAEANSDLAEGHVWESLMDDRTDLPSLWRSKGFDRVILTDGYETEWRYKLN
jgi:hypothetical protein